MKKDMFYYADPLIFERAKALRNNMTHDEMKLWGYLRAKPFGFKFRRQHPIGNYIVDFYCHALHLVIEVDGNIHDQYEVKLNDRERQSLIEQEGITVIRFTNKQVSAHYEETISSINVALLRKKTPIPPSGG